MSALEKGVDTAVSAADKAIDESAGLAKKVLGGAGGVAKAVVAAPVAFVAGSVVENLSDWTHKVAAWLASVL